MTDEVCSAELLNGAAWGCLWRLTVELLNGMMPDLAYLLTALTVGIILSAVSAIVVGLTHMSSANGRLQVQAIGAVFVLATLALIMGVMTGLARESIIGDVSTVLLGGAGALFSLSLVKSSISSMMAGLLALSFSMAFYLGGQIGADERAAAEARADIVKSTKTANQATQPIVIVLQTAASPKLGEIGKQSQLQNWTPNSTTSPFPTLDWQPDKGRTYEEMLTNPTASECERSKPLLPQCAKRNPSTKARSVSETSCSQNPFSRGCHGVLEIGEDGLSTPFATE